MHSEECYFCGKQGKLVDVFLGTDWSGAYGEFERAHRGCVWLRMRIPMVISIAGFVPMTLHPQHGSTVSLCGGAIAIMALIFWMRNTLFDFRAAREKKR